MGSLSDNIGAWPELRARNDAERTALVAGNPDPVAVAVKNRVEALLTTVSGTVSDAALRRGLDAPVTSGGR